MFVNCDTNSSDLEHEYACMFALLYQGWVVIEIYGSESCNLSGIICEAERVMCVDISGILSRIKATIIVNVKRYLPSMPTIYIWEEGVYLSTLNLTFQLE